jgi:hypothetical protein
MLLIALCEILAQCGVNSLHICASQPQRSVMPLLLIARQWGNAEAGIMHNLQVLNSLCSFELIDIFLFENRFIK